MPRNCPVTAPQIWKKIEAGKHSTLLRNPGARDRVRGPAKLAMRLRLRRREPATLSLGNRTKGKK